jgi:hypothetical protein
VALFCQYPPCTDKGKGPDKTYTWGKGLSQERFYWCL